MQVSMVPSELEKQEIFSNELNKTLSRKVQLQNTIAHLNKCLDLEVQRETALIDTEFCFVADASIKYNNYLLNKEVGE